MQDENPYESPLEISFVEQLSAPRSLEIASQGKRFLNLIIDQIILRAFIYGLNIAIVQIGIRSVSVGAMSTTFLIAAINTAIFLCYFVVSEYYFGQTIAKCITGTIVVAVDGTSPSLLQIVGRTFCRLIPFDCLSFLSERPMGWHDKLSGTRVVMTRSLSVSDP